MLITVTHCTTSKESVYRIVCMLCQQTSPKRWFANVNMTSYCDVTNSVYAVTMTTIRYCSMWEFGYGAYNHEVAPGITRPLHATVCREIYPTSHYSEKGEYLYPSPSYMNKSWGCLFRRRN